MTKFGGREENDKCNIISRIKNHVTLSEGSVQGKQLFLTNLLFIFLAFPSCLIP